MALNEAVKVGRALNVHPYFLTGDYDDRSPFPHQDERSFGRSFWEKEGRTLSDEDMHAMAQRQQVILQPFEKVYYHWPEEIADSYRDATQVISDILDGRLTDERFIEMAQSSVKVYEFLRLMPEYSGRYVEEINDLTSLLLHLAVEGGMKVATASDQYSRHQPLYTWLLNRLRLAQSRTKLADAEKLNAWRPARAELALHRCQPLAPGYERRRAVFIGKSDVVCLFYLSPPRMNNKKYFLVIHLDLSTQTVLRKHTFAEDADNRYVMAVNGDTTIYGVLSMKEGLVLNPLEIQPPPESMPKSVDVKREMPAETIFYCFSDWDARFAQIYRLNARLADGSTLEPYESYPTSSPSAEANGAATSATDLRTQLAATPVGTQPPTCEESEQEVQWAQQVTNDVHPEAARQPDAHGQTGDRQRARGRAGEKRAGA